MATRYVCDGCGRNVTVSDHATFTVKDTRILSGHLCDLCVEKVRKVLGRPLTGRV